MLVDRNAGDDAAVLQPNVLEALARGVRVPLHQAPVAVTVMLGSIGAGGGDAALGVL